MLRSSKSSQIHMRYIWILIFHLISTSYATIDDIFHVKSGTTKGGCDSRTTVLEKWFTESQTLAAAGIQAFTDAKNGDAVALAILNGYFGLKSSSEETERQDVLSYVQRVSDFLSGDFQIRETPEDDPQTPWIFCDDTWLKQYPRTAKAFAAAELGEQPNPNPPYVLGIDKDGNEVGVAIQDVEFYAQDLFEDGDKSKPNKKVPYWSSDLQDYLFGPVYEAGSYCATQNTLAGADTEIIPRAITLCPASFQTTDPPSLTFLMPVQGKTSITSLVPQSGTFFHELFHLVWTRTHSGDAAYSLVNIQRGILDPKTKPKFLSLDDPNNEKGNKIPNRRGRNALTNIDLVRQNPETFVFFCVSYWYYLQTPTPENKDHPDWRYSFASGRARIVSKET